MIKKANVHIHTPYSFSAFENLTDALDMAVSEGVSIVGINDFYSTAGYEEWNAGCESRRLYPLFNMELISLNPVDQANNIRVNDPANPGRVYISGKGLRYPHSLAKAYESKLQEAQFKANNHVEMMCEKLNLHLRAIGSEIQIDFQWVKESLTKGIIRERHLAKALRIKLFEAYPSADENLLNFIHTLFQGKNLKSNICDIQGIENEIRSNLLKAGGAAFVQENASMFLNTEEAYQIIIASGGIPTYPFLADDADGNYTDFEANLGQVAAQLTEKGFHSVEFISTRNDLKLLEKYVTFLYDAGFVITLGSEHNSPIMEPLSLTARHATELSPILNEINYKGACVIAAHQYLSNMGLRAYVDENGNADRTKREEFEKLGQELIELYLSR